MRIKYFYTAVILVLVSSCTSDDLPETPCACDKEITSSRERIESKEDEILPYNDEVKRNYQILIQDLMDEVKQTEALFTHCDGVKKELGKCEENERNTVQFWDMGEYDHVPGEFLLFYTTRYTGEWEADSIQNSIANPEVAQRIRLRIWYKEEINKPLTDFESAMKDSLEMDYWDCVENSDTTRDTTMFPRMYKN